MRTGLDPEKIRERAVDRIYQQWHASEVAKSLSAGTELHLQDSVLRTSFHHHFRTHLAKDFILYSDANYPRVSVEFADGDYLWASVQVETSPGVRNQWQGQTRLLNNGYLIGVWLSGLILLAGQGIWIATTVLICFSFLWASHWNPLGVPEYLWERFHTGFVLIHDGLKTGDFDKDALAFLMALISIFVFLAYRVLKKKFKNKLHEKWRFRMFLFSLVLEPILVCLTFSFYKWSANEEWWRLYLLSWIGRFFCVPLLVHCFLIERQDSRWARDPKLQERPLKILPIALLIPALFYFGMGWDWLMVLASSQEAPVLMGFKAFASSFLIGLVIGSRPFAMAFGLLAFPMMLGAHSSLVDMSFTLGVYLDGLLLGWVMSPWMMSVEPWRLLLSKQVIWLLVCVMVLVGLMLSSVGIPYMVPWVLSVMVLWGFYNLNKNGLVREK